MKIAFKNSFLKALQKVKDPVLRDAIFEVITNAENSETLSNIPNLKKLKGYTIYYRIRLGNYRIGLKWDNAEQTLYFVTFDHRKDIYKNFP